MNTWIYDLEVYPNYFTGFFKNLSTGEYKQFTDSTLVELCVFLNTQELILIGFNNGNYDDKILAVIIDNPEVTTAELKAYNDAIIEKKDNSVIKSAMIKVRKGKMPWYSIDIKAVTYGQPSLKKQQIKYRWHNVLETPISFDTHLTEPQKVLVDAYCKNDVDSTEFLYNRQENIDRVNLRLELAKKYQYLDGITNINTDSALGGKIMEGEMIRRSGLTRQDIRAIIATKRHHKFYFVGKDDILPSVKFSTPHNQAILEKLKGVQFEALTKEERAELKLSDPLEHFILKMPVSGDTYKMGEGGAHSKIGAAIATDNIWHADVASYYPSMILNIGKQPMGCPEEWIQIYDNVLTSRLEAKNNGNKAEAQFLKIPLNATYGQMGSRDSMSFDRSSLLRVTVNGQLMILMLCESLELNGHKLLSVNTDGIFFTAGESNIDNARDIVAQWSKNTHLGIDVEKLDAFVSSNVSACAVMEHGVWTKRNDVFSEFGAKETAAVVSNAVLNHIVTGESIDTFIKNCTDVYDFLTPKIATKQYQVVDGVTGEALQGVNRIYRSKNGVGIIKRNIKTGKESSLANNVTVLNNISTLGLPNDIDYSYYIKQAEDWYDKLASSENVIEKSIPVCDRKVSFTITESVGDNRVKPEGQLESTWQNFIDYLSVSTKHKVKEDAGLISPCKFKYASDTGCKHAFYTKKEAELGRGEFNTIKFNKSGNPYTWKGGQNIEQWYMLPVDIDEDVTIEEARERFSKYEYVLYSTFSHQLGLNGDKFRILFLLKKPVSSKYLKDRKIPIQEWIGSHDKSSLADFRGFYLPSHGEGNKDEVVFYHNTGELLDLSKFEPVDPKPKMKKIPYNGEDRFVLVEALTEGQNTWGNTELFPLSCAMKAEGFSFEEFRVIAKSRLRDEYQNTLDLQAYWQQANAYNPESTYTVNKLYQLAGIKRPDEPEIKVCVPKDITVLKPLYDVIEPELIVAYDRIDRYGVIQAGTGAGKSTLIVAKSCELVMGHEKVLLLVQGKDHMSNFADALRNRLGHGDFNSVGIFFHEAIVTKKYGDNEAVASIPEDARAVVTHFTYAGRWGATSYVYEVLRFIDSNTTILIDEVDAYIDSLILSQDMGARAKRSVIGGDITDEKIYQCRIKSKSGNCSKCVAKHDNAIDYKQNTSTHVYEFKEHVEWSERTQHTSYPKYDYLKHSPVLEKFKIGTNELTVLKQSELESVSSVMFHSRIGTDVCTIDIALKEYFTSAFRPTIHRPFIESVDGEVRVDEIVPRMLGKDGKYTKENLVNPEQYQFPRRPCNVLTFVGIDRKPFLLLRQAKKLVGFSATVAKSHKEYLTELLDDCKFIKVSVAPERKLKKLIVVGMGDRIAMSDIVSGEFSTGGKEILKFSPTKRKAALERLSLVESGISARLADGKLNLTDVQDHSRITNHNVKYFITHAFGSLGRGTDLPEFPIININLANYKPTCAYSTDSKKQLVADMFELQVITAIQNAGRGFRWRKDDYDDGIRIVLIENVNAVSDDVKNELGVRPEDLYKYLLDIFGEMFEEIEEWLVPEYLSDEYMLQEISEVLTTSKLKTDRLVTWQDCIEEVRQNGKGSKKKIHIDVLANCPLGLKEKIRQANDEYVSGIKSESGIGNTNKTGKTKDPQKVLEGKLKKIDELRSNGLKNGQILSQIGYKKLDDFIKCGIDIHIGKVQEL